MKHRFSSFRAAKNSLLLMFEVFLQLLLGAWRLGLVSHAVRRAKSRLPIRSVRKFAHLPLIRHVSGALDSFSLLPAPSSPSSFPSTPPHLREPAQARPDRARAAHPALWPACIPPCALDPAACHVCLVRTLAAIRCIHFAPKNRDAIGTRLTPAIW